MGYQPSYQTEARIYAKHILATKPSAKIGVLYQNDDFGKDYLIGLKDGLGADNAGMIVKEASYETSEPTVDSQVVTLQGSGADVFLIVATPKFAAQAIRKSYDLGWNAVRYITNVSVSIATILKPVGLEKSKGLITGYYGKDPTDKRWADDAGLKQWKAFTDKYMSPTEFIDANAVYGFGAAQTMVQVLKQCGNDLSRDTVMKQAASLKDLELPMLLPGMKINTSPTNYSPIRQMQLATFNGAELGIVRRIADRLSDWRLRAVARAALAGRFTRAGRPPRRTPGRPRRWRGGDGARTPPGSDRTGHDAAIPSFPP